MIWLFCYLHLREIPPLWLFLFLRFLPFLSPLQGFFSNSCRGSIDRGCHSSPLRQRDCDFGQFSKIDSTSQKQSFLCGENIKSALFLQIMVTYLTVTVHSDIFYLCLNPALHEALHCTCLSWEEYMLGVRELSLYHKSTDHLSFNMRNDLHWADWVTL